MIEDLKSPDGVFEPPTRKKGSKKTDLENNSHRSIIALENLQITSRELGGAQLIIYP